MYQEEEGKRMKATVVKEPGEKRVLAKDMREGQCGRFEGELVLRVYDGLVSLSHPGLTWEVKTNSHLSVILLPPGTQILLETEI